MKGPRSKSWVLSVAIVLTISGAVMLLGSRERPRGDALVMYEVADSMVVRHRIDVRMEWPPMSQRGADNRIYSQYALAASLAHLPGVLLRRQFQSSGQESSALVFAVTSHLAHAVIAGLACLLFFGCCRRLGVRLGIATVSTLALASATTFFVYARSPFSEILQAAAAMAFVCELLRIEGPIGRGGALRLGLYGGLLINTKLVFAPSVLVGFAFVAWNERTNVTRLLKTAGWVSLGFAPLAAAVLWYNHTRWGSAFDSGYGDTLALMTESPLAGLWGLLLSPGKSFFVYSPPCLLALFGWPALARRLGTAKTAAVVALLLWPLLFYSRFLSWSGDFAWGPRYLVFLVAPLMLGFAVWVNEARQRWRFVVASLVVGAGLFVQVLGAGVSWEHHIRLATQAREEWLGTPDRRGAAIAEQGRGHCDSCFEDMHGHQWLPPFSPISGHIWLLSNLVRGHSYDEAQPSAPWRRYTSLDLHRPRAVYDAARIDWWGNLFLADHPEDRDIGIGFLLCFVLMTLGGALLWWIALRRRWSPLEPEHTSPKAGTGARSSGEGDTA